MDLDPAFKRKLLIGAYFLVSIFIILFAWKLTMGWGWISWWVVFAPLLAIPIIAVVGIILFAIAAVFFTDWSK
jgi:hypothetical protein